jgi:hypothetical protein
MQAGALDVINKSAVDDDAWRHDLITKVKTYAMVRHLGEGKERQ